MFKERRISVGIDRTINLGNYESKRIHVGFDGTISDDEDLSLAYRKAWRIINKELTRQIDLTEENGE